MATEFMRDLRLRACLAIAFFFLCLVAVGKIQAAPRMEIDQPLWNFGIVTNLAVLTHDFVIRNAGDVPLEISSVVSSCNACLRAGVEQTKIPPGGTTVLHSQLDLRLLSGDITRAIMIDCNDPQSPSSVLELAGVAVPAYQVVPAEIDLDLSQGQQTAMVEIRPLFKLHADLSQVVCDDTNLVVTVSPESSAGFVLTVQAKKMLPRGETFANVTARSADSNDLPCHLIAWIHNPPDLELIPLQLTFLPQAEPQMRILWLKQHGAARMTLLDAIPSTDKYHCEIDPDANGFDYRIYVTVWEQQPFAGKTNALTLKMVDSLNHEQSVTMPIIVEAQ